MEMSTHASRRTPRPPSGKFKNVHPNDGRTDQRFTANSALYDLRREKNGKILLYEGVTELDWIQ